MLDNKSKSPSFISMHLNSTHHDYYYPKEFEKFLPVIKLGFDIFSFSNKKKKQAMLLNRYKNSILFIDDLINKIIDIANMNKNRKSIVVIYGDHGEEFGEKGKFCSC